jgi:nucleoside-diphosphate-sugar epimerase
MKIVIIGATGTIGRSVVALLSQRHEVVTVSRSTGDYRADIGNKVSLEELFSKIGTFDAVVCAAGSAAFKPLASLSDDDFATSLNSKLMGQVNVVRVGSRTRRIDHHNERRARRRANGRWRSSQPCQRGT